ncbi:MAG TPA: condensation domain-containing protein, partial [Longimicrobiaceae bacterium]
LYVGGGQVARGYLDRPGLTAERFVPDPFAREPGARLYRTGDLGRWRPEGSIEFLGRTDFQVKIRGFRIELGEIEARLAEHAAVRGAVVLAREDEPGDRRLVAYVVADEGLDVEALRAHLAERLPSYMVPAAFVRLDAFPVTAGAKVDRRALPAPEGDDLATRGYEAPASQNEVALAEIWAEVLRVERVGRRDSFFDLGGHSLLAVQVISRVRQRLAVEVALRDLFTRPVLADFAGGLETASRAELPAIEPVERGADLPLSFAQQRLWFIERLEGAGAAYHIPMRQRLRGELDLAALRRALDRIVARHEALRTTFARVNGEPEQRIAPVEESAFALREHDLGGHSLLAVQVISRVRQALEVEVKLGELFTRPVLTDFARELETAARAELPPVEPAPREGRLPLSFAQQRLWFLEQLGNLGSAYHIHRRLRLWGPLDRAALVRALDRIVARHEALRTTFSVRGGEPEQRIAPETTRFHLVEHDLAGAAPEALERLMAEEAAA